MTGGRCVPSTPRGGFLGLGLLREVVTGDKASRSRPREGMTTADIMTGNPADDGASDASLGENGCGRGGTGDQSNNQSDFTEHAFFLEEVCCKRNSPHHGCKRRALQMCSVTVVYAGRLRAEARLIADAVAILSGAIKAQRISDQSMSDRN